MLCSTPYSNDNREKQNELIRSLQDSQGEMEILRDAFTKIDNLISYYSEDAPSKDALIPAVQAIAEHYRWSFNKDEKPKIDWINRTRFEHPNEIVEKA